LHGRIPRYFRVVLFGYFFGSDFEFCIISLLVMLKIVRFCKFFFDPATIGGDTIIPLSLKLNRIDLLSLRLSGIEFSLV
jgi:hypothetical protein